MLFGHQDNQPAASAMTAPTTTSSGDDVPLNPLAVDPQTGASLPVVAPEPVEEPSSVLDQGPSVTTDDASTSASDTSSLDAPAVEDSAAIPDPSTPFSTAPAAEPTPEPEVAETTPVLDTPADEPASSSLDETSAVPMPAAPDLSASAPAEPEAPSNTEETPAPPAPALSGSDNDALLSLKQQAINELSPLVSQLDQTPEEKFRTTMMLIQSTDNSALLQEAHNAAQAITDEKVRAQALLDIVNEINYFTQQSNS